MALRPEHQRPREALRVGAGLLRGPVLLHTAVACVAMGGSPRRRLRAAMGCP